MKVLICIILVAFGCQISSAQSTAKNVETSINKIISDFNFTLDKQDSLIAAGLNKEVAAFKLEAKSAITAILTETVKASNFAVNGSIANAITFSADICERITLGVTWLEYWYRPALMNKYVTDFVVTVKGNFSKPVNELKNQAVATILSNPKAQSCIENAVKDIPILSSNVNKILTSTFLTASNNFTSSSKVMHKYIQNNVTLIVRNFDDCLKLKPTPIVFDCIDNLIAVNGTSMSNVYSTFASDVYYVLLKANKELDSQTNNIFTSIKDERDKIAAKMEACISPK